MEDILTRLSPDRPLGAIVYLVACLGVAAVLSRALSTVVHGAMSRGGHFDRTTVSFLQQLGSALIWVLMLILYAHLIPELRAFGSALLAGASIASVVIGLAAQTTLSNLVAGVAITIYKPFRLGDTLQVATPTGTEIGVVEFISLGYTTLKAFDGRRVVLPNSVAASQVSINLSKTGLKPPLSVAISIGRDADIEAARDLAVKVGEEVAGNKAVEGCYLTKVDGTVAVLELKLRAEDANSRDTLRSKLMADLARRFSQSPLGAVDGQRPSFS